MIARRDFLTGAAAGFLLAPRLANAKASQPATPVNFDVPAGACDCHTHIHGDPATFPWFPGRTYTPEMALPEEMTALHKAIKMQRVVIVTPSVYGPDNSATILGMKARGNDARGVAVIDDKTSEAELDRLASLGFKGIRLNLSTAGISDPRVATERFVVAAERVKRRNWHIQLNTTLPVIAAMKDTLAASPVPLVFDHYGNANEELGVGQPGFADLVSLVKSGKHQLQACEFGPIDVKVLGNVAVIQGSVTEKRIRDGKAGSVRVAFMDVFMKRGDKWVAVRSQAHKL